MSTAHWGETASLSAALLWALSVSLFRPAIERHGAQAINLLKSSVAAALMGATALLVGWVLPETGVPWAAMGWLALSGVVGLTLGDTALFAAVARMGPHRSLLLQTLAPLFTASLAMGLWNERLTALEAGGGALVLLGVAVVVAPGRPRPAVAQVGPEGTPAPSFPGHPARPLGLDGLIFGVLAAAGQGVGIVLAKGALETVPLLPATFVRLAAGAAGLVLVGASRGLLPRTRRALADRGTMRWVVPATFLGTYLAMLLMMAGIAWARASVAAVLLATPPVFSLLVEVLTGRERLTVRGLLGTLLAVVGVALL